MQILRVGVGGGDVNRAVWVDPALSLGIVIVILISTWGLLKDAVRYSIDAVPEGVDIAAIRQYLLDLPEVDRLHDLHVWPLSTTETALTVHLVVEGDGVDTPYLIRLQQQMHDRFGIEHSTIQIETRSEYEMCTLDRDKCG
mgnify:CR=1 FL=1